MIQYGAETNREPTQLCEKRNARRGRAGDELRHDTRKTLNGKEDLGARFSLFWQCFVGGLQWRIEPASDLWFEGCPMCPKPRELLIPTVTI
jgi:hypothetical protein